ncbi:MAG: HAD family hydrolase [Rhodospirillaceae bacterium]|nr:HAD family hydrolase [Rhodospirillaceae bacterium]
MQLPCPRAILFDWDNTLVDSWPCIGRATNITLQAMGREPWDDAELRRRVAGSLRDTFPLIYGDRWEEAGEIYIRAFAEVHIEMLQALAGAEDLLRDAAGSGIYLGVVSNKTGKFLRAEAEHLGWTALFGCIVGAQDAARDKPAPDPIHLALQPSGIAAGPEVWFVGDAPIDVICGRAAGCRTVFVGSLSENGLDVINRPDHVVADCRALAGLVRASLSPA